MLLFLLPLPVLLLLPLLTQEQCSGACGAVSDAAAAAAYCARVICAVFIWGLLSLETRAKSVRPRTGERESRHQAVAETDK